ncbi:MAG: hypothetical protein WC782_07435 [Methylococcaceae bacterium]|jgi:hypothetical protein
MKKYPMLLFVLGLLALILLQKEVVMPLVNEVIKSDLFLVDTPDKGDIVPVSTNLSKIAFKHCNNLIKAKLKDELTPTFADKALNSWDTGNYQYVINGTVDITSNNAGTITKKYICKISYKNGGNEEGALDINNWSLDGLSGI